MMGALCNYVAHAEPKYFQPMKANFGIIPEFEKKIKGKRDRYEAYANRALHDLEAYLEQVGFAERVADQ
jgi:methylenetetrahydrofolate--tRNA-(uracil-5-)-methyltransferase